MEALERTHCWYYGRHYLKFTSVFPSWVNTPLVEAVMYALKVSVKLCFAIFRNSKARHLGTTAAGRLFRRGNVQKTSYKA